jgi:hypothetical protein
LRFRSEAGTLRPMSSSATLEDRVNALEVTVRRILSEDRRDMEHNWRRAVGMFAGDDLMKEIDQQGAKIRAEKSDAR